MGLGFADDLIFYPIREFGHALTVGAIGMVERGQSLDWAKAEMLAAFENLAYDLRYGRLSGRWGSTLAYLEVAYDYMNLRVEGNGGATI